MNALINTNAIFRKFSSIAEMIEALSIETTQRLSNAIQKNGCASCVAAGGTTVPPLLEKLSNTDIAWDKVHITLSDERWVEPGSTNSNQYLIQTKLLQNKASKASLVPLWRDCDTPKEAAIISGKAVSHMPSPFEVTLLGMGADMHAASLFPNAPGIIDAMDTTRENMVCKIGPVGGASGAETRLSLSLKAILNSKIIYIMIVGDEKLAALTKASALNDPIKSPVSAILHQTKCPVHVYWAPKD